MQLSRQAVAHCLCGALLLGGAGCDVQSLQCTFDGRVEVTPARVDLWPGQTLLLTAIPAYCEDDIYWTSDNPDVAVVDYNSGLVTALQEGQAIISAEESNTGCIGTCRITVRNSSQELRAPAQQSDILRLLFRAIGTFSQSQ